MLVDNNSVDISLFAGNKTAGRVNFNTSSQADYLTNENFKTLRTNLLFCGADIKTIVITSSRENEGKSTISAELAKSLAEAGKKTLLLDADMRKSVLLRRNITAQNFFGLSEFLSNQVGLEKILYNTQNPNFDVVFSGHFPPNPVELLGSDRFGEFLKAAKTVYDYIIIDSPPLNLVIDAAVTCAFCDGAIMVITPGKIGYKEAIATKAQIEKSGCKLLGAILNDVDGKLSKNHRKYYKNYEYTSETKQ